MQYLNTVNSRKNGWWKPALLAALMVLPACSPPSEPQNNLVCEQGGSLSTLVKSDSWYAYTEGTVRIESNGRSSLYRMMHGELCYGVTDAEFAGLLKNLQQQAPSF